MNNPVATKPHPLSDRINNLPASATLAMAAKGRELKEQGKDIISLSLGEPGRRALLQLYGRIRPVSGRSTTT